MSVANSLIKALPLVFMIAANANAGGDLNFDNIDLSKPVDGCVHSNDNMSAFEQLTKIMNAQSQKPVGKGNERYATPNNPLKGVIFTMSDENALAYYIGIETPIKDKEKTEIACFIPLINMKVYDKSLEAVPAQIDSGDWKKRIETAHKNGIKAVITATTLTGKWFLVHYGQVDVKKIEPDELGADKKRQSFSVKKENVGGIVISENGNNFKTLSVLDDFDHTKYGEQVAATQKQNTNIKLSSSVNFDK